jgi:hypothetical protein
MLGFHGLPTLLFVATIASSSLADPPSPPPAAPPPPPTPAPGSAAPAPASPAPAPAPESPSTPAPASAPAPVPVPAAPAAPLAPAPPAPRHDLALVHLAVDYPGAVLELRNYVDSGEWKVACNVPCDRTLVTLGAEARVSAPGMSTSNVFRVDPGPGVALVKVNGGSATARTFGILGLGIGIPLGLTGTAMYSYGSYGDDDGLALAGGVILGTGAAMILAAIPLLLSGTTNVRDGKGRQIAATESETSTE